MQFVSTRGDTAPVDFRTAVELGLAPDGGLFMPAELPDLSRHLAAWEALSYPELAAAFLQEFTGSEYAPGTLPALTKRAYAQFAHREVAPLVRLDDTTFVLELFHGPTLAFKDFALQVLGLLYEEQIRLSGRPINVLGATSGDTGAAAIHGMLGREGAKIFILYPDGRVSPLQERQMACTGAPNVFTVAVDGSFDDAQAIVKDLFGDVAFRTERSLAAVNSINLARVLAQCVYYFWAWFRLPPERREGVVMAVPTGNFGNVLAGWMARRMGLPVAGFEVATNQNDILDRLFRTGVYEVGAVRPSLAPSMDIQVASNFERFLSFAVDRDPARVRKIMATFRRTGRWVFDAWDRDVFTSSSTTDAQIPGILKEAHQRFGYVADPHTACAFQTTLKGTAGGSVRVILATAHPAKFPDALAGAIGFSPRHPSLEALRSLPLGKVTLPAELSAVRDFLIANT